MSSSYASVKAQHSTLPAFSPPIPTSLLPYIAFFALLGFFILSFSFSTLPRSKNPIPELGTAALASILAGGGVVALFCTVGVQLPAARDAEQIVFSTQKSDLEWIHRNASLPKIIIYSTGGTILSASRYSRLDTLAYGEGQTHPPTARTLIDRTDEVLDIAQLAIVTLPWAKSNDLTSEYFVNISRHFALHGCPDDTGVAGGVVLHGTSTLAERLFGIDLTLSCPKPIVGVGSMRPQEALSSDANLYQAVSTAVSLSSRNRGALIVANDHISSAYFGTKSHANNPDTFIALEQGHLGYLFAGEPYYVYDPAKPTGRAYFDLSKVNVEFNALLLQAAADTGAFGIVVAGMGAGDIMAEKLVRRGIPVVVATRPYTASSFPNVHPDAKIKTNYMSAEHARIQLQLCRATGLNMGEIRDVSEGPFRRAVCTDATSFYNKHI